MKNKNLLSSAVLLLAAMIWGFAFVAQNELADTVAPFTVNAVRSLIASAVLVPTAAVIRQMNGKRFGEKTPADRKKLIKAGIICGTMLCISANLQQFGIALYPDGAPVEAHSGFLTAMYILFVPLFGLFMGKKPPFTVMIGVGLAAVGLYFLCLSDGLGTLYFGDVIVLICGICYAIQILCVDHFISEVDPVKLSSVQFLVCGVLSAILMLIFEEPDWGAVLAGWRPMLFLALMSSGIAYTLQIVGQKYASGPTLASILMSMESVFALIGGAIFMGVLPKPVELFGCAIMLAAIIIAQLPPGLFKRKQA